MFIKKMAKPSRTRPSLLHSTTQQGHLPPTNLQKQNAHTHPTPRSIPFPPAPFPRILWMDPPPSPTPPSPSKRPLMPRIFSPEIRTCLFFARHGCTQMATPSPYKYLPRVSLFPLAQSPLLWELIPLPIPHNYSSEFINSGGFSVAARGGVGTSSASPEFAEISSAPSRALLPLGAPTTSDSIFFPNSGDYSGEIKEIP